MPSLQVTVLSLLSLIQCFLSLKIPEEHDLESQIRKEREWRFLRNTRVRKQAQQVIQKGERTAPPHLPGLCVLLSEARALTGRGSWNREGRCWGRGNYRKGTASQGQPGQSPLASDLRSITLVFCFCFWFFFGFWFWGFVLLFLFLKFQALGTHISVTNWDVLSL